MKTRKVQKYECSNWFNPYSGQRYPVYINSVRYTEIVCKKTPNGMLCVSAEDVDGHFCSVLKCYKNAKGERYCIFGKHRLYEGYDGPVELVGVPVSIREAIVGCGARIAD